MPPARILRPILGASSRLLQQQCSTGSASTAGRLAAAIFVPRSQVRNKPSWVYSFDLGRQLRFSSSSKPPPPEPPNFDHLKPEDKSQQQPNFDHLRPVEEKPKPPPPPPPPSSPQKVQTDSETSLPSSPSETATSSQNASTTGSQSEPTSKDEGEATLPSHSESQRSRISTAFTSFMDQAQSQLFVASQRINDLTGYSGIETLKNQIADLETGLARAQETLHATRTAYKTAVADRAATQREVTTLLARQKTWTPADFERFTALYRTDYELDASVADRARELEEAEREAERINRELSGGILARYHEEQIWSDKIRRMSTWGTWGLMGVNILLFFMFQFGAEPWRRARLVKGFEEKVREALAHEREKEKAERIEVLSSFFGSDGGVEVPAARPSTSLGVTTTAEAAGSAPEKMQAETETVETETATSAEVPVVGDATPDVVAAETPELPDVLIERTPIPWRDIFTTTTWWKETAADLTSERKVAVRMCDVSVLALEGAAAGAAIAGTIALFFLRRT